MNDIDTLYSWGIFKSSLYQKLFQNNLSNLIANFLQISYFKLATPIHFATKSPPFYNTINKASRK